MTTICKVCRTPARTIAFEVCYDCTKQAIDYAIKVADQCKECGLPEGHPFHLTTPEHKSCKSSRLHHTYERRNKFVEP